MEPTRVEHVTVTRYTPWIIFVALYRKRYFDLTKKSVSWSQENLWILFFLYLELYVGVADTFLGSYHDKNEKRYFKCRNLKPYKTIRLSLRSFLIKSKNKRKKIRLRRQHMFLRLSWNSSKIRLSGKSFSGFFLSQTIKNNILKALSGIYIGEVLLPKRSLQQQWL